MEKMPAPDEASQAISAKRKQGGEEARPAVSWRKSIDLAEATTPSCERRDQ